MLSSDALSKCGFFAWLSLLFSNIPIDLRIRTRPAVSTCNNYISICTEIITTKERKAEPFPCKRGNVLKLKKDIIRQLQRLSITSCHSV